MKVINLFQNGDGQLYLFGVDENVNGVFAVYSKEGDLISKNVFDDYTDIKYLFHCVDTVAYCLFARSKEQLDSYFKMSELPKYENRRIYFEQGKKPVNLCTHSLKKDNSTFMFGLNDNLKKGILTLSNKDSQLITEHYFNEIDDFRIFNQSLDNIGYCMLLKHESRMKLFLDQLPEVPEKVNVNALIEHIIPINIREVV